MARSSRSCPMKTYRDHHVDYRRAVAIGAAILTIASCNETVNDAGVRNFPLVPDPVGAVLPDSLLHQYRLDANRLAVRQMEEMGMMDVRIPDELSASLLNCLGRIYNARHLPARDTVVDLYSIHSFPSPQLHEVILLGVNRSCAWVSRLTDGHVPTGEPVVDSLMLAYGLSYESSHGIPGGSQFIVLRSSPPLNIRELAKRFAGVPCITGAEPNGVCCDGNDIRAVAEGESWLITFRLAWGDCPAGCISSRFWDFRVGSDGTVVYVGSRGTHIPEGGPGG